MERLSEFIRELQARKVFRVASVYVVVLWILVQGAIDLFPVFGLPDWSIRLLVVIGVVGFPIAVLLAWALLKRLSWPRWAWRVPVYAIGSMAAFWTIERIAGFA